MPPAQQVIIMLALAVQMCILAGCDFVKALPGIGIKKAHQQIRQRKSFVKVGSGGHVWVPTALPRWLVCQHCLQMLPFHAWSARNYSLMAVLPLAWVEASMRWYY
jgi:hypothetical protein